MPDVTVTGNDNFVIVAGGDVYAPTAPAAPSTGDDRRNLVNLLGHVRRTWITGVLEHSVSQAALLDPPARMEPGAVEPAWRRCRAAAGEPAGLLPPDRTIGEVFEEAGSFLLILGEPGAGKTTTLLTLARECVERAERDPAAPVPVVLSLSSWTGSRPFRDWLVAELSRPGTGYGIGKAFARRWLKEHRLLLLLDGLDEVVGEERRAACVRALHAYVEEHGAPGLAVCCRSAEYEALGVHLKIGVAVRLLPLEPPQIDAYLDAAGPAADGLRGALEANEELCRAAESPLMLSIMILAFRGCPAGALSFDDGATREELRDEIFGRFVARTFGLRERPDAGFSRERVEDGLRWLASGMIERGSTFAVELLQPGWLTSRERLPYLLGSRAAGAIVVTMAIGTVVCLCGLVLAMATGAAIGPAFETVGGRATVLVTLAAAVAMGLLAGLFHALLGYHTLRRSGEGRPEPGMVEELGLFFGYLGLSGLAALLVVGIGRWGLGLSLREPPALVAFITVSASALSLPLIFGRKAGRGSLDGDISLAGTLSWRWRTAVETAIVCAVSGAVVLPFSSSFEVSRLAAVVVAGIVTFTAVAYGSWRQEVPPVDRWKDGEGSFALLMSGRVFAYAGLACVLGLFPLLALAMGPGQSLRDPLSLAVLVAIVLFTPALFWFGGIDVVLHAALRLVLSASGTVPLHLRRFLEYAVHLGFLRRAGGGYIFFHRLLLEHFAARPARGAALAAKESAVPASFHLSAPSGDSMSNIQVSGDNNVVISAGRDARASLPAPARPAGGGGSILLPVAEPPLSFISYLRDRLVEEKGLHDLSRNAELASFPLIGFRASAASMDFVAFHAADRLTESRIVSLRNEFFDAVQHVSREFGLKPRGRNPNGLLAFVFEEGCPESMARFIRKQTRISHRASTGAVTVSWAIDLEHRRIHTHENPVSLFPPVIVMPQTVFPGLGWLESALGDLPDDTPADEAGRTEPTAPAPPVARPPADRIRILFLGANSSAQPLDLEREVSRIQQDIRMARERDALEFRQVGAVTIDTLMQAMLDESPTIVHFAGHGETRGILLRDEVGNPRLVTGDALASLFALFRDTVRCVVLNACWSEAQAHAIRRHVPHVIGTRDRIPDAAALAFSGGFYKAIGAGKDVPFAFEAGKARVHMEGCGGEDLLVLL